MQLFWQIDRFCGILTRTALICLFTAFIQGLLKPGLSIWNSIWQRVKYVFVVGHKLYVCLALIHIVRFYIPVTTLLLNICAIMLHLNKLKMALQFITDFYVRFKYWWMQSNIRLVACRSSEFVYRIRTSDWLPYVISWHCG